MSPLVPTLGTLLLQLTAFFFRRLHTVTHAHPFLDTLLAWCIKASYDQIL